MPEPLNRRQAVGLGAVVVAGWAVGQVLRRTAPIGRDVGPTADLILTNGNSPEQGPADATLRLAVFTDYRCPACRHAFHALEEAVERDSKVKVIYKDWPIFGPPSERAASIALACAEQEIYPAIHRQLMTDSRIIDDDMLRDAVTGAGGDWQRATKWLALHALIRGIDSSAARRTIVASVVRMADELGIRCIAEGIETAVELQTLREIGLRFCQGYLLARPEIETLPLLTPLS